jgi:hypothetical protein
MTKRLSLVLVVVGLLALGGQSFAELCTVDAVPAATLLVPYFEVGDGVTTLFSINNASAAPTIAHVIFWTDWSFPTIDFDIYLTGYDVATVNVADIFEGIIPLSADPPNDPFDAQPDCGDNVQGVPGEHSSPCGGAFSQNPHWDNNIGGPGGGFPFCQNIFPNFTNPVITGTALSRLVNGHSGQVVPSINNCVGDDHGDGHFRGYITIDNSSQCSLVLDPGFPGYFVSGGTGIANNINQLWGDWFLVDDDNNFAQGETLVHIEAHDQLDAATIPLLNPDPDSIIPGCGDTPGINNSCPAVATVANTTGYTFYGRYFAPPTGPDNREPLGTIWGSRYLNGGVFDQTELVVWRDSTADDIAPPPNQSWCNGNGPSWFPLNETEVIAFNESEDAVEICFFTGGFVSPPDESDPPCFPWETHRYTWGEGDLSVPFNFGWAYLNLNLPPDAPIGDADFGSDFNIAQSYVATLHSALGRFSVGLEAVQLYDACEDFNEFLNGAIQNGGVNIIDN